MRHQPRRHAAPPRTGAPQASATCPTAPIRSSSELVRPTDSDHSGRRDQWRRNQTPTAPLKRASIGKLQPERADAHAATAVSPAWRQSTAARYWPPRHPVSRVSSWASACSRRCAPRRSHADCCPGCPAAVERRLRPIRRQAPAAGGGTSATVDLNTMQLPAVGALGDYLWLTPTKLGGGAQVQDLAAGKTMAWIEYWNYGDSCPIAHHLAAFPVGRSTQGLRVRQHDPRRPERPDLWHPHADPGARDARSGVGPGQPDLPRRIRRPADEPAREHRGDDGHRRRRAYSHLSGRHRLFRLRWPEGCRRVLHTGNRHGKDTGAGRVPLRLVREGARRLARAELVRWRQGAHHPAGPGAGNRPDTTIAGSRATSSTGRWCRWASTWSILASYRATPFAT